MKWTLEYKPTIQEMRDKEEFDITSFSVEDGFLILSDKYGMFHVINGSLIYKFYKGE